MASEEPQIPEQLFDFIKQFQKEKEAFENARVRIGIIGESGCGKSSLINKFAGEYISEVGVTETTNEPLNYAAKDTGVIYTDLPGSGTEKWPIETYVQDLRLDKDYDAFIIVNRGRILENDIKVYEQIRKIGTPVFLVRNFFDAAVNGERQKPEEKRRSDAELRAEIEADFRKQFKEPKLRVFLTASAPNAPLFDFEELRKAIVDGLDGISEHKANRFVSDTKAYGREMLERKRDLAYKHVHGAAAAAAAVNALPVPGAGIAADIAAIVAMNVLVFKTFNLDPSRVSSDMPPQLKAAVASMLRFGTKEGVIYLLKRVSASLAATEIAKWVPLMGTAVAVATTVGMIEYFGRDVVNQCYDISLQILDEELKA